MINSILKQLGRFIVVDASLLRFILAVVILLAGLIFRQIFVKLIVKILLHFTKKTKSSLGEMLVHAFERPALSLITGFSIWASLSVLPVTPAIQNIFNLALRIFFVIIVFWFLFRASDTVIYFLERFLNKTDKKADPSLMSLLNKMLKFLLVIIELFIIIDLLGYNVSGIIAGFGLGGLAISLAAKDAAANLLGSITIMIDKTYRVGEWIETEKVEGVVEEIGFRSTKIRNFSNSLVSIPNSLMSSEPVTNWSKMGKRKVSFTLDIPLDTPHEKIETLLSKLRDMLHGNEDIDQDQVVVSLKGFGTGTLVILLHFFTKTTSWMTYLSVTEAINLSILRIFEETGVVITVPAQKVLMESGKVPSKQHSPQ